eukprot:9477817-Pyramimonas_sp.AAC.1
MKLARLRASGFRGGCEPPPRSPPRFRERAARSRAAGRPRRGRDPGPTSCRGVERLSRMDLQAPLSGIRTQQALGARRRRTGPPR